MANGDLYWMMVVGISIAIAIIALVSVGLRWCRLVLVFFCACAAYDVGVVLCLLQLQAVARCLFQARADGFPPLGSVRRCLRYLSPAKRYIGLQRAATCKEVSVSRQI